MLVALSRHGFEAVADPDDVHALVIMCPLGSAQREEVRVVLERARALAGTARFLAERSSQTAGRYSVTRRIRSSPGLGSVRPSRLEVVTHSDPSGARATERIRPYSPAKCCAVFPASAPSSTTDHTHSPCSAPSQARPAAIAMPLGEHWSTGHSASGSAYPPLPSEPSTSGQP